MRVWRFADRGAIVDGPRGAVALPLLRVRGAVARGCLAGRGRALVVGGTLLHVVDLENFESLSAVPGVRGVVALALLDPAGAGAGAAAAAQPRAAALLTTRDGRAHDAWVVELAAPRARASRSAARSAAAA